MKNLIHEKLHLVVRKNYASVLFATLFLILDSLVFILPYYLRGYTIPVGWDTPWYIRNMRLIEEQGIFSLFIKTREINFFCIAEYLFASIFNVSFTFTTIVVPIIIALLFPIVNFQIVKNLTKSKRLSLIAILLTIIDYNVIRMAGTVYRNFFCLLLIEIAIFLVLPNFLKKPSKKGFFIFVSLAVIAGISHMETFAVAIVPIFLSFFFYLKTRSGKFAKLLLLCILVSASLVILLESPFLISFLGSHMTFNPAIRPHRQNFFAQPEDYAFSLGMGLIPFFIVGTYVLFKHAIKYHEPLFQFLFFWNLTVIAGSFLPVFSLRVPGWRFLVLLVFTPVAILGIAKFLAGKRLFSTKKLLFLIALIILLTITVIEIMSYQNSYYRPWITRDLYDKFVLISDDTQDNACMVILNFNKGVSTFDYAELYRNWIWAVVSTKAKVYFGNLESLNQSKPTNFENPYQNITSYIFWDELENVTLEGTNIYLIGELYENSLNNEQLEEVQEGIYRVEYQW